MPDFNAPGQQNRINLKKYKHFVAEFILFCFRFVGKQNTVVLSVWCKFGIINIINEYYKINIINQYYKCSDAIQATYVSISYRLFLCSNCI
jgi:hypothetical protein